MGLKLRLNYFACLPHHMLGMSSVNQAAASLCAAECLLLWDGSRTGTTDTTDQLGGDAKDQAAEQAAYRSLDVHSHPVAVKLLSRSGELRAMVEAVAQGAAVKDVPPLDRVVKKWRFLSVIERSIEAKHSIAKKRLSHNSVPSAASFSLSIRMLEISSAMQAAGHEPPRRLLGARRGEPGPRGHQHQGGGPCPRAAASKNRLTTQLPPSIRTANGTPRKGPVSSGSARRRSTARAFSL